MKIKLYNKFHNSEATITLKNDISLDDLDYLAYNKNAYAIRKQKEIKNKLCGMKDCSCSGMISIIE